MDAQYKSKSKVLAPMLAIQEGLSASVTQDQQEGRMFEDALANMKKLYDF